MAKRLEQAWDGSSNLPGAILILMELNETLIRELWKKEKLQPEIQKHCKVVEKASLGLANELILKDVKVNPDFVKYGALLHDIGRSKDHSVRHGLTGYEILQKYPEIPEEVRKIVKFHIGAGISKEEAAILKIKPAQDLIPITVEEKIVSYVDNLVSGTRIRSFEETLGEFEEKLGKKSSSVERLKLQREELENFVTRDEIQKLEVAAVENGATIEEFMERAGIGVAEVTNRFYPVLRKKVVCFVGTGNNGGDASVAARHLKSLGANVLIAVLGEPHSWASKINFMKAKNNGIEIKEIKKPKDLEGVKGDIAIDGIFGIGIKGEIREPFASAIRKISEFKVKVAIDIPSGLNPDTGEENNPAAEADLVVCIARFKKGLIGKYPVGTVQLVDIGL